MIRQGRKLSCSLRVKTAGREEPDSEVSLGCVLESDSRGRGRGEWDV